MSFKFLSAVRCVLIQVRAAKFSKPQSSAGVEMFWSRLGGQGETGRRTAGMSHLAFPGSALVLLQQIAREIWTLVLCELNYLVGLPMTRSQGSGETENEGERVNQTYK